MKRIGRESPQIAIPKLIDLVAVSLTSKLIFRHYSKLEMAIFKQYFKLV